MLDRFRCRYGLITGLGFLGLNRRILGGPCRLPCKHQLHFCHGNLLVPERHPVRDVDTPRWVDGGCHPWMAVPAVRSGQLPAPHGHEIFLKRTPGWNPLEEARHGAGIRLGWLAWRFPLSTDVDRVNDRSTDEIAGYRACQEDQDDHGFLLAGWKNLQGRPWRPRSPKDFSGKRFGLRDHRGEWFEAPRPGGA